MNIKNYPSSPSSWSNERILAQVAIMNSHRSFNACDPDSILVMERYFNEKSIRWFGSHVKPSVQKCVSTWVSETFHLVQFCRKIILLY